MPAYAARPRSATLFTMAALAAVLLIGAMPHAAAASTQIRFFLYMGDRCLQGSAPAGEVRLVWRDASGDVKARATVESDGWWFQCFGTRRDALQRGLVVSVGDRIKATIGSDSRTFTVPRLRLVVDRVRDVFRGKAPPGTRVHLDYAALYTDVSESANVRASANGTWRFDPDWDVVGGHFVGMAWESAKGDDVYVSEHAPFVMVTLGKARFTGVTRQGRAVEVTLLNGPAEEVKAVGEDVADLYGRLDGRFLDDADTPYRVVPGDRLVAMDIASDAEWIVPKVNARADTGADTVSGRCFDSGASAGFFEIHVLRPDGRPKGFAIGNTEDERFSVEFDGTPGFFYDPADIRAGDTVEVRCRQQTGDWVAKRFVIEA